MGGVKLKSVLYWSTIHQGIRYLLMTGLSAGITLGLPILLHEGFDVNEEIAVSLALGTSFLINFVTIRVFVFRSIGAPRTELLRFGLTSAGFRIVEYLLFLCLHTLLDLFYVLALGIVLVVSLALKFYCYRVLVFSPVADKGDELQMFHLSRWN